LRSVPVSSGRAKSPTVSPTATRPLTRRPPRPAGGRTRARRCRGGAAAHRRPAGRSAAEASGVTGARFLLRRPDPQPYRTVSERRPRRTRPPFPPPRPRERGRDDGSGPGDSSGRPRPVPRGAVRANAPGDARGGAGGRSQLTRDPAADSAHARHARHPPLPRGGRPLGVRDQAGRPARGGVPARGRRHRPARPLRARDHRRVPGTPAAGGRPRRHPRRAGRRDPRPGRTGARQVPVAPAPRGAGARPRPGGAAGRCRPRPPDPLRRDATGAPVPAPRRGELPGLGLAGPSWSTPAALVGHGAEALRATREHGLEGLVCKRLDSVYEPGVRSRAWIKIRNMRSEDVIIGGWLPGKGRLTGLPGAVLVGQRAAGRLRYVGGVGTGWSEDERTELAGLLRAAATDVCPFDPVPAVPGAHWVVPRLVG